MKYVLINTLKIGRNTMRASTPYSSVFVCLSLSLLVACGDAKVNTSVLGPSSDKDVGESDPDTSNTPDAGGEADVEDPDTSSASQIDYQPCVLGEAAPWDECAEEDIFDFGTVSSHDTVMRRMRIDNLGGAPITITGATIDDPNFEIVALTYTTDDPPTSSEVAFPAELPAGESLFIEVTLKNLNAGQALVFEADSLELEIDTGADTPETVSVELIGDYGTCGTGFANCDDNVGNGCEVNLNADPLHCGTCRNACSDANGEAVCAGGQCGTTCSPGFDSCDSDIATGCETDIQTVDDCGGCGVTCEFDNASAQCSSGTCEFDACATGWMDLNADLSDGCEYECTFQSNHDLPDITTTDANCDGIDGDISRGIFVATTGSDTTGAGTMASPYQSIGYALTVASQVSGLDHLYVAAGEYNTQLILFNGISIYGGYDPSNAWSRDINNVTRIHYTGDSGRKIAMRGENITSPTTLGMLTISTNAVTSDNGNNTALHCVNCSGLILQNNNFIPGDAGDGMFVGPPNPGGGAGGVGGNGRYRNSTRGAGGSGGLSGCGRNGGKGGAGGAAQLGPASWGLAGMSGVSATPGGAGTPGVRKSNYGAIIIPQPGKPGAHGAPATHGQHGSGGSGGQVVNGFWQGVSGGDATDGTHGNGGGGGGGGGCAGRGGKKGSYGGSAFGLFLIDSTGITLSNNTILAGNGGNGGAGTNGSNGSPGASGRPGGIFQGNNLRTTGGAGGNGSSGGNSYGIFTLNSDPNGILPGNNTITAGQPGAGGTSLGNPGANGVAQAF